MNMTADKDRTMLERLANAAGQMEVLMLMVGEGRDMTFSKDSLSILFGIFDQISDTLYDACDYIREDEQ